VADYAISTNLISWVLAKAGLFGWPVDGAEAEVIEGMRIGDLLVPKFAQNPDFGLSSQAEFVKALCEALDLDYEEEFTDYQDRVDWGRGAVPFVWTVRSTAIERDDFPGDVPWKAVAIRQSEMRSPFSTSEFLRLRALPIEIARQFKAMAAPGRHVQQLPDGAAETILRFGGEPERSRKALRVLSLVRMDGRGPFGNLESEGRAPLPGDLVFLVGEANIPGFFEGDHGSLAPGGESIEIAPRDLPDLMERAAERATESDGFRPAKAVVASRELADFIASGELVRDVPEFGTFYDCYMLLPKKVSQALELADRDLPQGQLTQPEGPLDNEDEDDSEQAELDNLHGLTVAAAKKELPRVELPDSVLAEAVTALRAGKHLLLSGPPGTGKSTIAMALCRAVVGSEFDVVTATADWTTFETIGGYMPRGSSDLEFEPGLVLRALQRGRWLVVDEINRADIDKAFGPLFTLLSGTDGEVATDVVLPFRKGERSIRVVRSERRRGARSPYALTPAWRMIGTLNARDKASLFQLSFAFLRRFALVDVPLPSLEDYREIYTRWNSELEPGPLATTTDAAMLIAMGRRQLGPAILKDIAEFTRIGLVATDTASREGAYDDAVTAFLTAVRLYAVPQYEGAGRADADDLLQRLRGIWPEPPLDAWEALERAFDSVVLS
jgi:MoxR-like ATPase